MKKENIETIKSELREVFPNSIIRLTDNTTIEVISFIEDIRVNFMFTFYPTHFSGSPKWGYQWGVEDRFFRKLTDMDDLRFYSDLNKLKDSAMNLLNTKWIEYEN